MPSVEGFEAEPWLRVGSGENSDAISLAQSFREEILNSPSIVIDVLNNPQAASIELPEGLEVTLRRDDHDRYGDDDLGVRRQRIMASMAIYKTVHDILDNSNDGKELDLDPETMDHFVEMLQRVRGPQTADFLPSISRALKEYHGPIRQKDSESYRLGFRVIGLLRLRSNAEMTISYDELVAQNERDSQPIDSGTHVGVA
jgi:hypothetical protein